MQPDDTIPLRAKGHSGIRIRQLSHGSPLIAGGLRNGDTVFSVNGEQISDELDFQFAAADAVLEIELTRGGRTLHRTVHRDPGEFLGVDFHEKPINRCRNKCVFCFIDQMPPGLRQGLYIKDEDFKHSFLNGNYVTLTGASEADLAKVARIGLSPLFISVHATDHEIRNRLLGIKRSTPVIQQLTFLRDNGISFHTQIVVCPGYNDGRVLIKTIRDLMSMGSALQSIAVVPVGLTRFRSFPLEPVTASVARAICRDVSELSDRYAKLDKFRRIFLADELFIRASLPIPSKAYYADYPQIGNGVGLVRQLLDQSRKIARSSRKETAVAGLSKARGLLLTSVSAYPFVSDALGRIGNSLMVPIDTVAVENRFFGELVTVAGLLTAKDVVRSIKRNLRNAAYTFAVTPRVMFNCAGHTLDGWSVERMSAVAGIDVRVAGDLEELVEIAHRRTKRSKKR